MSYILNALKKAERDRLREDSQDLNDFSSAHWDPYQPTPQTAGYLYWLLASVLLLMGLLLGGLFSQQWMQSPLSNQSITDQPLISEATPEVIKIPVVQKEIPIGSEDISAEEALVINTDAVPDFIVAGHMFIAEGSSSNRLFIGDRSFREGDALNQTWTLVAIQPDNFVIRSGNRSEILRYR